jgi:FkbM family methyltransferase
MPPVRHRLLSIGRPVLFRGKVRLTDSLTPRSGTHDANLFGYNVKLDLGNFIDRMMYMGCYEALNTYRFRRILREGMTVVDVGANIGYFTLLAASCVGPKGRVVAVEPFPANFQVLDACVKANAIGQVTTECFGLGAAEGGGKVSQANQADFNNRTATMASPEGTGLDVRVAALDDCMSVWGLSSIDLLKIDVDGFESRVLEGAAKTLQRGLIKNIIIELDAHWLKVSGSSTEAICETLTKVGFRDVSQRMSSLLLGPLVDRHFRLEARR